ncbi:MAG TPA: protein-glutamate O-methyltransferase CheR [Blastocatellia bacterium]|nr:protein-glutamate O-methyltransferase CheR [Blastocatellia bacterium]
MAVNRADFDYLSQLVRDRSAIVIEPGKEYLIESRLTSLARREGFDSLGSLVASLRANSFNVTHRKVVEAMTTNETTFFRDLHPFEALKRKIVPELTEKLGAGQRLNIWSAASSSGQEAYSIAMLLHEHFPAVARSQARILATDISQAMLERTREGRYSQLEVNRGLPAPLLMKYFERHGLEWRIREDLRRMVEVREFNLAGDWSQLPPMDIVFLRNVLIYFDQEMKKSILGKLRRILKPGGYLFLGSAETLLNLNTSFVRVQAEKSPCYQLPV